jgi:hypothetical protein
MKTNAINLNSYLIGLVVTACAAPTAALNIWPRIESMIARGISGNEVGIVILVTMSALGMASVPFAMRKADNKGFWLLCLVCGLGLALVNYLMAVGAIGKVRDGHASEQAKAIYIHQALETQLHELEAARSPTEPRSVSEAMLQTAREAVRLAVTARDQECGKVGDFCRARVAQVSTRQEELADLERDAATAERDAGIRQRIERIRAELLAAGPAPVHIDAQAGRIAAVLGLGGKPADIEKVANWIINILAVTAEGFALLMPRIIVTALAGSQPGIREVSILQTAGLPKAATVLVPRVQSSKGRAALAGPVSPPLPAVNVPLSVKDWVHQNTHVKPGNRVKTWDAYVNYKGRAGKKAITFTEFSFEMEALGHTSEKVSNRSFYKDLSLT